MSFAAGAVLHEDAMFQYVGDVPINIKNTNSPEDKEPALWKRHVMCRVNYWYCRKDCVAINIEKDMIDAEIGFGRRYWGSFLKNGISFEHMPSGVDTAKTVVYIRRV